jgi:hypothetical protein
VPNLRDRDSADFNDVLLEKARIAAMPSPFARALASQKARGIEPRRRRARAALRGFAVTAEKRASTASATQWSTATN